MNMVKQEEQSLFAKSKSTGKQHYPHLLELIVQIVIDVVTILTGTIYMISPLNFQQLTFCLVRNFIFTYGCFFMPFPGLLSLS